MFREKTDLGVKELGKKCCLRDYLNLLNYKNVVGKTKHFKLEGTFEVNLPWFLLFTDKETKDKDSLSIYEVYEWDLSLSSTFDFLKGRDVLGDIL